MSYIKDEFQLAVNIRSMIRQKGIKQIYIAEHLGISPQRLNDLLAGRRQIKVMELVKVAELLNVSIDKLCAKGRWSYGGTINSTGSSRIPGR